MSLFQTMNIKKGEVMRLDELKVGMTLIRCDHETREVLSLDNEFYTYKDSNEETATFYDDLKYWNEVKTSDNIIVLYECINNHGMIAYLTSEGLYPSFNSKKMSDNADLSTLKRKTGRTIKLNLNNWELF